MTLNADKSEVAGTGEIAVWDLLTRIFHWSLVAGFVIAYVTEDDLETVHVWAGYGVGGLILFRLVWGIIGPERARFSSFVTSPGTAFRYAGALLSGRANRHIGHSPAGGLMIVALLAAIAGIVVTGVMLDQLGDVDWIEEVHEIFAHIAVLLVVLHIGGVFLASFAHRENLVRAMFTGRKRVL